MAIPWGILMILESRIYLIMTFYTALSSFPQRECDEYNAASDWNIWLAALSGSHTRKVRVSLLNSVTFLSHQHCQCEIIVPRYLLNVPSISPHLIVGFICEKQQINNLTWVWYLVCYIICIMLPSARQYRGILSHEIGEIYGKTFCK